MAKSIDIPNIGPVELNWATEETLNELLNTFKEQRKYLRDLSDINKRTSKQNEENSREQAKYLKKISEKTERSFKSIKNVDVSLRKVGNGAKKLAEEFDRLEATAESTTSSLLKVVGGLGTVGTVIGFAAGMLDKFVAAQTAAIQSGFSFSDQLIESRVALANIGLNLGEFATIIANNGEAVRSLGRTGDIAAKRFSDLVFAARAATEQIGYFGLTGEEMAGELADLAEVYVRAGLIGPEKLINQTVSSFKILNKEVLGYARITGKQRREIMRNRAAIDADSLFLSAIGDLGPKAVSAFQNMTDSLTSVFGESAPFFIDLIKKTAMKQMTGIETRTAEELAFMSMSGLSPIIEKYSNDIIQNSNDLDKTVKISRKATSALATYLQEQESTIRRQTVVFQSGAGNPLSEFYNTTMQAIIESRAAERRLREDLEQGDSNLSAFNKEMDKNTKVLITFRNELEKFQENLRASFLSLFGTDEFSILSSLNLESISNSVNEWTTTFNDWSNYIFGEDSPLTKSMVSGIIALWTNSAVINAMVIGIGSLFGAQIVVNALAGAVVGLFKRVKLPGLSGKKNVTTKSKSPKGRGGGKAKPGAPKPKPETKMTGAASKAGRLGRLGRFARISGHFAWASGLSLEVFSFFNSLIEKQNKDLETLYEKYPEAKGLNYGSGVPPSMAGVYLDQLTRDPDWMKKVIESEKKSGKFRMPMKDPNSIDILKTISPQTPKLSLPSQTESSKERQRNNTQMNRDRSLSDEMDKLEKMIEKLEESNRLQKRILEATENQ